MKVLIVTPVPVNSTRGNGVTARRWRDMLADLGHEAELRGPEALEQVTPDLDHELLIALHAERSHGVVKAWRKIFPQRPIIVVMTGTDLYQLLPDSKTAQASLELADRIVVLHPSAYEALPQEARSRARLVIQSATPPAPMPDKSSTEAFAVCVLAHVRRIKDPLLTARAARELPPASKVRVTLAGGVLEDDMRGVIEREVAENDRFTWAGELSTDAALDLVASSDLLVMSSQMEGGANVISEALACDVAVLASQIPAAIGMLGADYPGLFPVGDVPALADLLQRTEGDSAFRARLAEACRQVNPLVDPRRERSSLAGLLTELEASLS